MSDRGGAMQVSFQVPLAEAEMFDLALEPFCDALSWLEADDGISANVIGIGADGMDADRVRAAVEAAAAAMGVAAPDLAILPVPSLDWVSETQKAFPPVTIGRFFVHGSHVTDAPPPGAIPLCIGAGAAFGTGEHESTAGCLMALDGLARYKRAHRVLDMGCGTGILSLASARLWPLASVCGVDVDGRAVAVARTNASINGVASGARGAGMKKHGAGFHVSDGYRGGHVRAGAPYDIIIANILARPLMSMAPALARHLAPGGYGVLAGFLKRDANRVLAAHRVQGLALAARIPVGDWETLVVRRS